MTDKARELSAEQREGKRAYDASYYRSHKEERIAYLNSHREEKRAHDATYYVAHKDEKRAYRAAYYPDHKGKILQKMRQEQAEFKEWLQILRAVSGCDDCETHEGMLHHHHLDPPTKRFTISGMYNCSLDTLEDELEKCVVLCQPCHMKRHAIMRRYCEGVT